MNSKEIKIKDWEELDWKQKKEVIESIAMTVIAFRCALKWMRSEKN